MASAGDDPRVEAAKDTLMNIAAVSGVAVRELRPAQTLVADLGVDDNGLAILAEYQARIAARLATGPPAWPHEGERFREDMVWQVFSRTLGEQAGQTVIDEEARRLVAQALAALRGSGVAPE